MLGPSARSRPPLVTAGPVAELAPSQVARGRNSCNRGWRDMETGLDLPPVSHRPKDRIRAHIVLPWVALLPALVAENQTGQTWLDLRDELQCRHAATSGARRAAAAGH